MEQKFNKIETTVKGYEADGTEILWGETDWEQRGRCSNPPVGDISVQPYETTLTYSVEGTDFELVGYKYFQFECLTLKRPQE